MADWPKPHSRLLHATSIGFITGFFVPRDGVAAAETDGPVGTALLAASLGACGVPVRIAVDSPCADAVRAAVHETGVDVAVDEVGVEDQPGIARVAAAWREAGVSHAVSIERCGLTPDGRPRNMRGVDVSPWTAPLDDLFTAGDLGKDRRRRRRQRDRHGQAAGRPDRGTVPNGERIACITSCDHLVVAGVSNWGAYGLMAALAVLHDGWSPSAGEVPDRGTRPRDHPGDRREGGRRRRCHGAERAHGRRLYGRRPCRRDPGTAAHCLGSGGGLEPRHGHPRR